MALWIGDKQTRPPTQVEALKQQCAALEKENTLLRQQVQALEEQAVFHEQIFMEIAEIIYA